MVAAEERMWAECGTLVLYSGPEMLVDTRHLYWKLLDFVPVISDVFAQFSHPIPTVPTAMGAVHPVAASRGSQSATWCTRCRHTRWRVAGMDG